MNIIDIIEKKYNNKPLTQREITYFIQGICTNEIKDYQASALLMAIRFNDMNEDETYYLTKAMIESGKTLNLSEKIDGITVDKHSIGGVGDKTSLVLVPLLASLGFKVAKMSGRGLGPTGGTIDKLNSIPNMKTELSIDEFINQVQKIGCANISQSNDLVLADKLLYSLRDVTGTVKSIPLIVSSILSKKLAVGADIICVDVKVGTGAFCKTKKEAYKLSKLMINTGKRFHKKIKIIISSMEQPLGNNIGNALEVQEALDTLQLKGPQDLIDICIELSKIFLKEANIYPKDTNYDLLIKQKLESKEPYNKFIEMIEAQHGKLPLKEAKTHKTTINCLSEGYITKIDNHALGNLLITLGGGRINKTDEIDYDVGFTIIHKINHYVKKDEPIFVVYSKEPLTEEIIDKFAETITTDVKPSKRFKEIYAII